MARQLDDAGLCNHWDDGDNPGAGPKGADSAGLNGNWHRIKVALMTGHTLAGAHGAGVIDKAQLATTVADGATIEKHATNGLQVKDDGIHGKQINADFADGTTVDFSSGTGTKQLRVRQYGVGGDRLTQTGGTAVVDETTLEFSANKMRVKDGAITSAKMARDVPRNKAVFVFSFDAITVNTFAKVNGVACTSAAGIVMPRAGYITSVRVCDAAGAVRGAAANYGTTYCGFSQGDRYYARILGGTPDYADVHNINTADEFFGDVGGAANGAVSGGAPVFLTMEVEFT